MLSVILLILKIIGIVLLCLLGLVLFLLLLVLLVPVRYKGRAAKQEAIEADVHVTWLLHLVHVIVSYGEEGLIKKIKIFGIALKDKDAVPEKKDKTEEIEAKEESTEEKTEEKEKTEENKESSSEENKTEVKEESKAEVKDAVKAETKADGKDEIRAEVKTEADTSYDVKPEQSAESKADTAEDDKLPGHKVGKKKKSGNKDKNKDKTEDKESSDTGPEEKPSFFEKLEKKKTDIAEKLNNIYNKLVHYKEIIDDPRFRNGIRYGLNRVLAALKHILPRKLKGYAHYGFEDPSTTGYITAAVGATYGMFNDFMKFEPDFENPVLEGNIEFRGHARLGTVLFIALQVILKKDCRFVYKTIKAEGND